MTETDRDVFDELAITRSNSLSGVLQKALEKLILSGELPPGSRLNELHLAARFGTSRGPLREAMRGLLARGLVDVFPNRGMFVRNIPTEEALEIYDLRAAIFGLAGRRLAERITRQHLDHLDQHLVQMDDFASAGDFESYYRVNIAFHRYLVTQAGSRLLEQEYVTLVNKLHLCRARGLVQPGSMSVSNREHRTMVAALAAADPKHAQDAFFTHVERSRARFHAAVAVLEASVPD